VGESVDPCLELLGDLHLLRHLVGGGLGVFEALNELHVLEDVALGAGELLQELGLQLRQPHLELILLLDQL